MGKLHFCLIHQLTKNNKLLAYFIVSLYLKLAIKKGYAGKTSIPGITETLVISSADINIKNLTKKDAEEILYTKGFQADARNGYVYKSFSQEIYSIQEINFEPTSVVNQTAKSGR